MDRHGEGVAVCSISKCECAIEVCVAVFYLYIGWNCASYQELAVYSGRCVEESSRGRPKSKGTPYPPTTDSIIRSFFV